MASRVLVVILSLAACGRELPEALPQAAVETSQAGQVDATAPGSGGDVAQERSPRVAPRRRLRLIEHHGPAEAPLTYSVVEPDDASETTPIVFALHGRGDSAEGFTQLARRLELDARVVVPDAPLPFGLIGGRQWFDMSKSGFELEVAQRVTEVVGFMGWVRARYPKAAGVVLLGFSQGAVLALEACRTTPEAMTAVVALSGFAVGKGGVKSDTPKVLVVAGTKDSIVPQERSWSAAADLESLGRPIERFSFAGPHAVPSAVVDEVRRFVDGVFGSFRAVYAKP